ncbi:unnamed protein product [Acanthoscelides obtectus]|uniref:Uncharacterized protein n=1 Tax=Acanthoscelides obtectus TaxID=200917 RepID=A0A9P0PPZ2_ACAOB|nr:unnamed protein product [Acanthoscelides obtectus]CAK1654801.1 hypothetical protein AOBTE_LOCUS18854 [Acanthoscelides obtectus]
MAAAAGLAVVHPLNPILKHILDSLWVYFINSSTDIFLKNINFLRIVSIDWLV